MYNGPSVHLNLELAFPGLPCVHHRYAYLTPLQHRVCEDKHSHSRTSLGAQQEVGRAACLPRVHCE